jgi:hypothetical protein
LRSSHGSLGSGKRAREVFGDDDLTSRMPGGI